MPPLSVPHSSREIGRQALRAMESPAADALAAAQAAAAELDADDKYGKQLLLWLSRIVRLPVAERPPKPAKRDIAHQ